MKKNKIRYLIGDVRDSKRCNELCQDVDIVIHAAAMKHVPICEYNSDEAKKTNFYGTKNIINASIKNKVKKLLFISTDKVVNPSSLMGKTKLHAEKLILNSNKEKKNKHTKLSIIRFGNIIGSSGSVLLKFLDQIKNNENLTVTSKEMTRFFITINYAVKQIINSIKIMSGSEIFIIKNMNAIKIYDLALALKKYYKFNKKITIDGLREGEKIYEELLRKNEIKNSHIIKNFIITEYSKVYKKNNINDSMINSNSANILNQRQIIKFLLLSKLVSK